MKSDKKGVKCVIQTVDSILTFNIRSGISGRDLMTKVCESLNISEYWWFGLVGQDKKSNRVWVENLKKFSIADFKTFAETDAHLRFQIKYYPENIHIEVLTFETKKYFFKTEIQRYLTGEVVLTAEDIVNYVTAYLILVCSAKKDLTPKALLDTRFDRLVPPHIANQYSQTKEEWKNIFLSTCDICKEKHIHDIVGDALSIMENSHMYGVAYYEIFNKKSTKLYLGVDACGLYIYTCNNKITPKVGFQWNEIYCVSYEDRKFIIRPCAKGSPDLVIYSSSPKQNDELLERIHGNHRMHMQRRQSGSNNSAQFSKALAIQEQENKEMKKFVEEKDAQVNFDNKVNMILDKAQIESEQTDDAMSELNMEYEKSLKAMQERVEEAERIAQLERQRLEKEAKEAEKYKEKAMELEKKVSDEMRAKESMALVETQLATQAELKALEVQRLAAELENLKMRHEADLSRLKELEAQAKKGAVARSNPVTTGKEQHSVNGHKPMRSYMEIKAESDARAKARVKEVGEKLRKSQTQVKEETILVEQNAAGGMDKFKTLKLVRKGNTKARVDEFEAL